MTDPRIRSDFSKFLVHLTKRTRNIEAEDNLINMIHTKTIEARNHHCLFSPKINTMHLTSLLKKSFRTVCFTEAPLDQINKLAAEGFPRKIKLQPYGIVFWRDNMIKAGANPAIYLNDDGTTLKKYLLNEFDRHFKDVDSLKSLKNNEEYHKEIIHYYSLINIMRDSHDFSWEREWRYPGNFKFSYEDIVAIVAKDPDGFIRKCKKTLNSNAMSYIKRIPVISATWSYEDIIEEMSIKIWTKNA